MLQDVMEIEGPATQLLALTPGINDRSEQPRTEAECELLADGPGCDDDVGGEAAADTQFTEHLLAALATMAVRSKRRQADLCAALSRAGLDREPGRVTKALRALEQAGCIEHLVPLYDGGVLMSVTSRGIEKLSSGPRWNMLDGAGFIRVLPDQAATARR